MPPTVRPSSRSAFAYAGLRYIEMQNRGKKEGRIAPAFGGDFAVVAANNLL